MELLNYMFPFNDFCLPLTLTKINKHYFGGDEIQLECGRDLYNYLVSPANTFFMRVESDDYTELGIMWGDVIIVERGHLKYDGPAVVVSGKDLVIKVVGHNRDFEVLIDGKTGELAKSSYWGTIAYVLKSEEEDFLDLIGQELFIIK